MSCGRVQSRLDAIETEIDALALFGGNTTERAEIAGHIASIRLLLAYVEARRAALKLAQPSDDFSLIRGLSEADAELLVSLGLLRFADLAALTAEDVRELAAEGLDCHRMAAECWIEQAAVLASGRRTLFAAEQVDELAPWGATWTSSNVAEAPEEARSIKDLHRELLSEFTEVSGSEPMPDLIADEIAAALIAETPSDDLAMRPVREPESMGMAARLERARGNSGMGMAASLVLFASLGALLLSQFDLLAPVAVAFAGH